MLVIIFIIAYFYHNLGLFVVSVEPELSKEGFAISATNDFESPRVKLFSEALENCNNISINNIPEDIDNYEGEHNGKNYVAYTFFLKNEGKKDMDYHYSLNIENIEKNVDNAAWVMFFMNGKPAVYAKERTDGSPERIYNYSGYPFVSANASSQVTKLDSGNKSYLTDYDLTQFRYISGDGLYEMCTNKFESSTCITSGDKKALKPGEIDKFTVVIWLEGDDPDCVDDIKNGSIGLGMTFTKTNDDSK